MQRFPAPRPSKKSYVKHRQDVTRQIVLPVAFVTVLIAVLAVVIAIAAIQGGGNVDKWAAVATIWIIVPLMGLMLVILALAWGAVFLGIRVLQVSPRYTGIAQEY